MAVRSLVVCLFDFRRKSLLGRRHGYRACVVKVGIRHLDKGPHLSGDTEILEKHVEREYYNLASDGLLEKYDKYFTGGMSEAAKRRIEAELESEFEMLDPSDHMDPVEAALEEKHLQDLVEQAAGGNGFVDGRRVAMGQVGATQMPYPGSRGGVNLRVVVPDGQTDDTWGETLCDLPKVKSYEMTYVELREAARRGDQKLRVYLNFIVGKFGDEGARQIAATGGTTSQGFDFGAWLLRNCYDVCEMQQQTRFQRRTRAVPTQMVWLQQRSPRQLPSQVVVAVGIVAELWMTRLLAIWIPVGWHGQWHYVGLMGLWLMAIYDYVGWMVEFDDGNWRFGFSIAGI